MLSTLCYKFIFVYSFIIIFFSACISTEINPPATNGFFDLSEFMDKEMVAKKEQLKKLRKTISLDGVTETKELRNFDFEEEIALFRTADINKVAWLDRYETDSIFYKSGQLEKLIYKSIDEDLRTKCLMIHYNTKNTIDSIIVEQSGTSAFAKSVQNLHYLPASGYRIENQQDITALAPHKLIVDVAFVY